VSEDLSSDSFREEQGTQKMSKEQTCTCDCVNWCLWWYHGQLFRQERRPDKSRIALWKDEEFNVIQLTFEPLPFLFLPHLRVSYIKAKVSDAIKRIRQEPDIDIH